MPIPDGPVLVTGGSGQVARALGTALGEVPHLVIGRPAFDFERPDTLPPLLHRLRPSLVVNAAAYTAVDRAETEPDAARRANAEGPAILAAYCAKAGIPLIHLSTDYVFDGDKPGAYVEGDATNPTGVYGRTKRDGEAAVLAACPQAIVLRTAWVYAESGRNFVLTMLGAARRSGAQAAKLRVVADQVGCPTAAADLARVIAAIAARIRVDGFDPAWAGVTHAAGAGSVSWHGFAEAIFADPVALGVTPPELTPIATADWPTPARRPANSRLDCARLAEVFGLRMPAWRDSLVRTLDAIVR